MHSGQSPSHAPTAWAPAPLNVSAECTAWKLALNPCSLLPWAGSTRCRRDMPQLGKTTWASTTLACLAFQVRAGWVQEAVRVVCVWEGRGRGRFSVRRSRWAFMAVVCACVLRRPAWSWGQPTSALSARENLVPAEHGGLRAASVNGGDTEKGNCCEGMPYDLNPCSQSSHAMNTPCATSPVPLPHQRSRHHLQGHVAPDPRRAARQAAQVCDDAGRPGRPGVCVPQQGRGRHRARGGPDAQEVSGLACW